MKKIAVIGTGFRITGSETPPKEILNVKSQNFDARLIETDLPSFPVNEINRQISEIAIVEAGLRASQKKFDGIFINTVGDYGLNSLRSALDIPVVGAGQSSMYTAMQLGKKFSIVSIWPPKLKFIYENLLNLYKVSTRCASIRFISEDRELDTLSDEKNFVTEMRDGEISQRERIINECNNAINIDGADTILLGCTCMSPISNEISNSLTVPVLNPMTLGYKYLETLLSLNISHSKKEYPSDGEIGFKQFSAMTKGFRDTFSTNSKNHKIRGSS
ncbi:MAG: hypothetical protein CFH01_00141 [Alphaproteobacteria bacterium MarineAlpha2_Bin1]|nr:MAG: hypothetical protein CFH01_00141 [Alphaproteobacteria bacterium MarineAlpha2_Bin1]